MGGAVVLPGVSHVSLFAATGSVGFPSPGGLANDWHMSVKEVLFERPYIVNSGPGQHAGGDVACGCAYDLLPLHRSEQGARPDQADLGLDQVSGTRSSLCLTFSPVLLVCEYAMRGSCCVERVCG